MLSREKYELLYINCIIQFELGGPKVFLFMFFIPSLRDEVAWWPVYYSTFAFGYKYGTHTKTT